MSYATVDDVQARLTRALSDEEKTLCETLLEDAAVMIDSAAPDAAEDAKKLVSCRMVLRLIGNGEDAGASYPVGSSQGSMSGLGYSQQWSLPSGGGAGELYIGKTERQLLGVGNRIGARSPLEDLAYDSRNNRNAL